LRYRRYHYHAITQASLTPLVTPLDGNQAAAPGDWIYGLILSGVLGTLQGGQIIASWQRTNQIGLRTTAPLFLWAPMVILEF
jgi:hypothetical protein